MWQQRREREKRLKYKVNYVKKSSVFWWPVDHSARAPLLARELCEC
jgi:hypothetical protein